MTQLNVIKEKLGLHLNMEKTKLQIFKKGQKNINFESININIENIDFNIKTEKIIKYLGLIIDDKLNFVEHSIQIKEKVNKRINTIQFLMIKIIIHTRQQI